LQTYRKLNLLSSFSNSPPPGLEGAKRVKGKELKQGSAPVVGEQIEKLGVNGQKKNRGISGEDQELAVKPNRLTL